MWIKWTMAFVVGYVSLLGILVNTAMGQIPENHGKAQYDGSAASSRVRRRGKQDALTG